MLLEFPIGTKFDKLLQIGILEEDVTAEVLPSHKKTQVETLQTGKVKVFVIRESAKAGNGM